eukprot:Phypoly_transcript_17791.p2 GENE.Phypoly_transcript_17791~~Phypoly_transcript_17791.p2  ORF type:complete len:120 (-),score=13.56 Phypoly_transcript_17791:177-536(-)
MVSIFICFFVRLCVYFPPHIHQLIQSPLLWYWHSSSTTFLSYIPFLPLPFLTLSSPYLCLLCLTSAYLPLLPLSSFSSFPPLFLPSTLLFLPHLLSPSLSLLSSPFLSYPFYMDWHNLV